MISRLRIVLWTCVLAAFCAKILAGQVSSEDARRHAERANEALKSGHPEKAIPEFQALVTANPDNADAQANLGVLLYFQGEPAKAVGPFRAALRLNPGLSKIRALLGLAESQLGQSDAARDDLTVALTVVDELKLRKQVGLSLLEVQTAQHDLAGAAVTVHELREKAPGDPEIEYAAYRIYSDMAGEALLSLSLTAPKSGQMQQAIAHELVRVRDLSGAIASMRRAIDANPALPGIHFELAEALHASDSPADRVEAEKEYLLALAKNPHETQAAVRLGDIYAERSDWVSAANFYQAAMTQQPSNADASVGLARVYSERGDTASALPLLRAAIQNDPTNILAHFRLSALYRRLQHPEDAARELAEYQRLKKLKDDLRTVYSTMKLTSPGEHGPDDQPKSGPGASR